MKFGSVSTLPRDVRSRSGLTKIGSATLSLCVFYLYIKSQNQRIFHSTRQSRLYPRQSRLYPRQLRLYPRQSRLYPCQSRLYPRQSRLYPRQSRLYPRRVKTLSPPGKDSEEQISSRNIKVLDNVQYTGGAGTGCLYM
jgi:hypothetical protein